MSAYLIGDIEVPDLKRYEVYRRDLAAIVARHGGEYLVRGGEFEVIEGDWQPVRLFLFRFPDRKAIHAFLDDPDYQPLRKLRGLIAKTRLIAVDGI
jgi:uncharacterized protein (DUF1330 family)